MSKYIGWRDKGLETQLKQSIKIAKANKYNAKRVQVDGIWFDSKAEAKYYHELKLRFAAGEISNPVIHPPYKINYANDHICTVILDFSYFCYKENQSHYVDIKGRDNPLSKLKRKLVEAFYGIKVEVIK